MSQVWKFDQNVDRERKSKKWRVKYEIGEKFKLNRISGFLEKIKTLLEIKDNT